MSYSEEFRQDTVNYFLDTGKTPSEVGRRFKVSNTSVTRWVELDDGLRTKIYHEMKAKGLVNPKEIEEKYPRY